MQSAIYYPVHLLWTRPVQPQSQATLHGTLHGIFGAIVFLLMPISIFVFLRRFRADPNWQPIQRWTLALGIIDAAAAVIFSIVSKVPVQQNADAAWMGLIQRSAILPFMVWIFVFALHLLRRSEE